MKTLRSLALAVACCATLIPAPVAADPAPECFRGPDKTTRGMMRGDVDGDGNRDDVWVGARKPEGAGCRFFLYVRTDDRTIKERLHGDLYSLRRDVRPIAIVKIDSVAGREVGVKFFQGASTSGAKFFTLRDGRLELMQARGKGAHPDDLWLFGGSFSGIYATDCARPEDTILSSNSYPKNNNNPEGKWIVERRRFRVEGHDLVRTARRTERHEINNLPNPDRFREFEGFLSHCREKVF